MCWLTLYPGRSLSTYILKNPKSRFRALAVMLSVAVLLSAGYAQAATSPSLGFAETFGILADSFTNTTPGTTVNGDLGYTTGPAVNPTVNGTTFIADATYNQAGIDQNAAQSDLNSQTCTFTFPIGAVDLASNVQFPTATYGPGVYCVDGAISVGTGGITLSGEGTYIFRTTGALDTVSDSIITLADGASACDVWWTAIAGTTLGDNSTFSGTVIDAAGITIGSMVTWVGRALSFGGTITTDIDTITAPTCSLPSASLTVTKTVVNDDSGELDVSDFPLFVGGVSVTSGVATTTLTPGTYTVSETGDPDYVAGDWGGDCAADGSITLVDGDVKTCTITNNDQEERNSRPSNRRRSADPVATTTEPVVSDTSTATATATTTTTVVPSLPNSGFGPSGNGTYAFAVLVGFMGGALAVRGHRRNDVRNVR